MNVAEQFRRVKAIVDATRATPNIVNPESRFVVVTYWWGRKNMNWNIARPCGDFYETILNRSIQFMTNMPFTDANYAEKLRTNDKFVEFITNKAQNHYNAVMAHIAAGNPVNSKRYQGRTPEALAAFMTDNIVETVGLCLAEIRGIQSATAERANLEELFESVKQSASPSELLFIRRRAHELIDSKNRLEADIRARFRTAKSRMAEAMTYQAPIPYEDMIERWERYCHSAGCNYMAVEYPEFAAPGGYQLAINAKPRFIQKALELCAGRSVLYIDGDMNINAYPAIFDNTDVDMMARGWHVDPRSSYRHSESILVDPYRFETSGGTMFFAQTPEAQLLLQRWIQVSETPSQYGKADDRILSLIFNSYRMLLPMKIVQLPVEYLWLSLDYDDSIEAEYQDRSKIFIEHPECLTSEDTAAARGAASSRSPKFYGFVESVYPRSESLMERVMFDSAADADAFRPYLNYMGEAAYFKDVEEEELVGESPFHVVPFARGFGKWQPVVEANLAAVAALPPLAQTAGDVLVITEPTADLIPRIVQALKAGVHVRWQPRSATPEYTQSLDSTLERFPRLEFLFVNNAKNSLLSADMFFFQSKLDAAQPVFFRSGNSRLEDLVSMSRNLEELGGLFAHNYQFLSRIRTSFLKMPRAQTTVAKGGAAGNNNAVDAGVEAEVGLEFLYGETAMIGGRRGRRQTRRRSRSRKLRSRKLRSSRKLSRNRRSQRRRAL